MYYNCGCNDQYGGYTWLWLILLIIFFVYFFNNNCNSHCSR